jgi:hypothetical protein
MNEEDQYLHAARTIRADPDLPDTLVPKLDQLIEGAASREGDERLKAIDVLVEGLRGDEWTRERLDELTSGGERGVNWTDGVLAGESAPTWTDGVLAGDNLGQSGLLEFTCRAPDCGYTNRLAYRPPRDEMPQCENPAEPRHALVL